jgi:hypothetical protein
MYHTPLNCLIATVVLSSLLLQGCKSGLHAIVEEPAVRQTHQMTDGHVPDSGDALSSGPLAVASSCTDVRISGMLSSTSPVELAAPVAPALATTPAPEALSLALVNSSSPSFSGPFTASSGKRVLFSQQRGQWQAMLQDGVGACVRRQVLPVVSSGDIGASVAALRGQDAWSARSRIHVLLAPHTSPASCIYVGKLGLLGGAPMQQAQAHSPVEKWVQGPQLLIEGSDKEDVAVFQIPSGCRYKDYCVEEEVLQNPSILKIYYVAANNEEEARKLEALEKSRSIGGKLGADINLLFGYTANLGSVEAGASNSVVKGRGSIHIQRSKHAALVVYGSTSKHKKSRIRVVLKVCLEEDTTPPQDAPSSLTHAHNHAQPNPYAPYPHPQGGNLFHPWVSPPLIFSEAQVASPTEARLRREYENKLEEAHSSQSQLRREYENKLGEAQASRVRLEHELMSVRAHEARLYEQVSSTEAALKQKEAQLNTQEQAHKDQLAHQVSLYQTAEAALKQKEAQLDAKEQAHKDQLAHQVSLYQTAEAALRQKEAQLNTKEQAYKDLFEAHAALETSQAALEKELATAAQEHKNQLAHQVSLYQTAEAALRQKEAQLNTQEQAHKDLAEAHAALEASQAALEEKLTIAAQEHKKQLAHQASLLRQKEAQLNTQEQAHKDLAEAHAALEASQAALEEKLTIAAQEYKKQLAHQVSLYQTAEAALKQKEAQLNAKEQAYKKELANQVSLYQTAEAALKQKEAQLDAKEQAHEKQLAQVLVSSLAFGAKAWSQYFGEVGTEPSLPSGIGQILNSACPFWPEKQVKDTHLLVLIPATVDEQPFTLDLLKELIGSSKNGGHSTEYRYYNSDVREQIGSGAPAASYWLLMTRDVLPQSRDMKYENHKALIAAHVDYKMPRTLEAATAILLHHTRIGERLYTDNPWTYTRCQDLVSIDDDSYPTVVGAFDASGLSISHDLSNDSHDARHGVAGCRRWRF